MSMCDDDCGDKERQQVRLIREILKMNPETLTTVIEKRVDTSEKFIESCLEHLKKIEIPYAMMCLRQKMMRPCLKQ